MIVWRLCRYTPYCLSALYKQQEIFPGNFGTYEFSNTHQNFLRRHSNGLKVEWLFLSRFKHPRPRHEQRRIKWGAIESWQGSCGLLLCRVVECLCSGSMISISSHVNIEREYIVCVCVSLCIILTSHYYMSLCQNDEKIKEKNIIHECLHHMECHIHPVIHYHTWVEWPDSAGCFCHPLLWA